MQDKN